MKIVIQRVTEAAVRVDDKVVGEIGPGLMVLVGLDTSDTWAEMEYCLRRILSGRYWNDGENPWKKTVKDLDYEVLMVSQFTLLGKMTKGSKPDFIHAMKSEFSHPKFNECVEYIRANYKPEKVKTGQFGAMMRFGKEQAKESDDPKLNEPIKLATDALDYSRFDHVGEEPDCDENIDRQAELLVNNILNPKKKDVQEEVEDDTSKFFDLKRSAAMQGCAHDRSKERELYERPTPEKLHLANRFRLDGNQYFKEKDFQKAGAAYLRGIIQLEYTFPQGEDEEKRFNEIKLALHLNYAATKLNMEDYDECFAQCGHALKIDGNNSKAYFRQ